MMRQFGPVLVLLAALGLGVAGCGPRELNEDEKKAVLQPSGLKILEVAEGFGAPARLGDVLLVHYTGMLAADGTPFDSSRQHGQPFQVKLGLGEVIPGWEEGLVGMKARGKRKLFIPARLAYGAQGRPPTIPPEADLIFDIELLSVLGVEIEDLVPGSGPAVQRGDTVDILYTGWIKSTGAVYDRQLDPANPYRFRLGSGQAIKGLELGILDMKVGGKRRLLIPALFVTPRGEAPVKQVPVDADLIIELELRSIK